MAKLILKFKDKAIKEYPVSSEPIRIGRLPDNHIIIDNPAVSKHHALIEIKGGSTLLTDLNSTNGTFLNDKKIQKTELSNGDIMIIGKHTLIYESEQEQPDSTKQLFGDFGEATMILDTKKQRDLLARQKQETGKIETQGKTARLVIVEPSGEAEYRIEKDAITIGKSHTADVLLKGMLIPPIAATIKKEGDYFYISGYGGWISVTVNGIHAGKRLKLNNSDIIEIRNYRIAFKYD